VVLYRQTHFKVQKPIKNVQKLHKNDFFLKKTDFFRLKTKLFLKLHHFVNAQFNQNGFLLTQK